MFARDGAARVHTDAHDLPHGAIDARGFIGIVGVVADVGMQVAVARMKDIADGHPVPRRDLANLRQHRRELRTRNDRILDDEVRGDASHRAERFLPPLPQPGPIGGIRCDAHGARAVREADLFNGTGVRVEAGGQTIDFGEQHRVGIGRVSGREDGCFHRANGRAVHHLECRGQDARGDDRRRRARGVIHGHEVGEQRADGLRRCA